MIGLGGTIYQYLLRKREKEDKEAEDDIQIYENSGKEGDVSITPSTEKKRRATVKEINDEYSKFAD